MRQNKQRKGMTLTEVIIALVIISIIVVGILSYLSSGFTNIMRLRNINVENFKIQEYFETELASAKEVEGTGVEKLTFTYQIGNGASQGIEVEGKTLTYDKTNRNIHLFVANQKEATLAIPDDIRVAVPNAKTYYYLGDTIPAGLIELPVSTIDNISIEADSIWLLSHRAIAGGDTVVVGNSVKESEFVAPSPVLKPDNTEDFQEINKRNFPLTGFKVTDKLRGKYLRFGGRAVNTYGKVGAFELSEESIWIMGLPVVEGLREHMDADILTNKGEAIKDAVTVPFINHKNSEEYSQNMIVRSAKLSSNTQGVQQIRQVVDLGHHGDLQFLNNDLSKGHTFSFLMTNEEQSGRVLTYNINDSLSWIIDLNKKNGGDVLTVWLNDSTLLNATDTLPSQTKVLHEGVEIDYQKDNAIQIRSSQVGDSIRLELFLNDKLIATDNLILYGQRDGFGYVRQANEAMIHLGGDTHINEIALYHRALTDEEIINVSKYFEGKYDAKYNAEQP